MTGIYLGDLGPGESTPIDISIKVIPPTPLELITHWTNEVRDERIEWFRGLGRNDL